MSVKSYFLILFLGIFIHAYAFNARNLGVTDSGFLRKFQANDNKIVDHKHELGKKSIQENVHTNARRLPSWIPRDAISPHSNGCIQSGRGICESSIHKGLLNAAKLEDSRQQATSLDRKDHVLDSPNIDIEEEEKVLMNTDYQPPHRKTPIHNK